MWDSIYNITYNKHVFCEIKGIWRTAAILGIRENVTSLMATSSIRRHLLWTITQRSNCFIW